VALECEHALALQRVPHVAIEIVVAREEVAARDGKRDGGDAAEDVVMGVLHELAVCTDVKETAARVVRPSSECQPIGEILYSVNIGFMSGEGLHAFSSTKIPKFGSGITSTRNEMVLVRRNGNAHNITIVVREFGKLCSLFNIPQDASHVATASNDLAIVEEAAAGEVSDVGVELAAHADGHLAAAQVVHGADVVQPSACDEAPRG